MEDSGFPVWAIAVIVAIFGITFIASVASVVFAAASILSDPSAIGRFAGEIVRGFEEAKP